MASRFPLVAKPDIGCRGAGVRPIIDDEALGRYLSDFPEGETLILQKMVDVAGEAGVFYVREPGARQGRIISLTLKYFPHVVGDGRRTLRELILADPRAGRIADIYFNRFSDDLDQVLPLGTDQAAGIFRKPQQGRDLQERQCLDHRGDACTLRCDR